MKMKKMKKKGILASFIQTLEGTVKLNANCFCCFFIICPEWIFKFFVLIVVNAE